jgi:hypothetical protein
MINKITNEKMNRIMELEAEIKTKDEKINSLYDSYEK